uniref:G-protein coupled receptors family 1 profile domain-containing protein n=1 Tax=Anopheles farauti TaxID=69004 RepID=A0A182QX70_9DIPT
MFAQTVELSCQPRRLHNIYERHRCGSGSATTDRHSVNGAWTLPNFACDFYIAMDVICSTSSIFNLVAISIDRVQLLYRKYPLINNTHPRYRSSGPELYILFPDMHRSDDGNVSKPERCAFTEFRI